MVSNQFEMQMRQRQTLAFIEAEPMWVDIIRRPWISDGSGGYKRGVATPVPTQMVRLVTPNAQLPERRTVDGRDVAPVYTLVAMPNASVMAGDIFMVDGVRHEVVFVHPNKFDALRAEVGYGR